MVRAVTMGSSIEGQKLDLKTRQFYPDLPVRDKITKQTRYRFHLGIRSSAQVAEAYVNPSASVAVQTSLTGVGDSIQGTRINGWSKKPLGKPHVSKGSASHSANFLSISGGCFANIEIAAREILENASMDARVTDDVK